MGVTVTILAYNEAENLRWLLPELKKVIEPLNIDSVEYLIVDSMKPTDDTAEVCREFGARYVNQERPGYGNAYRTAIRYAREELFLVLDADGSQDYTQIPVMYREILDGADVVIGSRYAAGGSSDDAKSSQIMSIILNTAFRMGTGLRVHDFSTSFRICRTQDLRRLQLAGENFDILEEIILKLKLSKKGSIVIKEVPTSFKKRVIGESKRSLGKFIVCFGQMLLYTFVLRALAGRTYCPEKHDPQAKRIEDLLLYAGVTVMTAIVDVVVYLLLHNGLWYPAANLTALVIAFFFAFASYKIFVLNSWDWGLPISGRELWSFVRSKIALCILDILILWVMVDSLRVGDSGAKIVDAFIVAGVNLVMSGYYIFQK